MDFDTIIQTLESLGSEQTRKTYRRHGAGNNLFGVKFGDLKPLAKKIGPNHSLALKLWDTNNTDAQSLALFIAEPEKLTEAQAEKWAQQVRYYMIATMIAGVIARSPHALKKMHEWMKKKDEYIRQTGYNIMTTILKDSYDQSKVIISDKECQETLKIIEKEIHSSANRARYAMNNTLIAIAVYKHNLTDEALEAAKRIGKVKVDHGDTSCKTPNAVTYIKKCLDYQKKNQRS